MQLEPTALPDVKVLLPKKFGDRRGFFSEVYNRQTAEKLGITLDFVQDNHSLSAQVGVLRGLHYQVAPKVQHKLVRVVHGAILDIAVDIRRASPTFGKHVAVELSADNWKQLYIPEGFAHGFVTLAPDTEVLYKVTDYYSPEHERGIAWDDPDLGISWGVDPEKAILSDKDRKNPRLSEAPTKDLL